MTPSARNSSAASTSASHRQCRCPGASPTKRSRTCSTRMERRRNSEVGGDRLPGACASAAEFHVQRRALPVGLLTSASAVGQAFGEHRVPVSRERELDIKGHERLLTRTQRGACSASAVGKTICICREALYGGIQVINPPRAQTACHRRRGRTHRGLERRDSKTWSAIRGAAEFERHRYSLD